jgi:glycine/D-amino acid oxidase-like deaminating enzyme
MTKVVIIGGSMAGLSAGVALHHLGLEVPQTPLRGAGPPTFFLRVNMNMLMTSL